MELSVIIPAYNESARLPRTLQNIEQYFATTGQPAEIIVVDDGSTDTTVDLVRQYPHVRLIRHPHNLGKGAAVRTGMMAARGSWRLFCDADESTPIAELAKLWSARSTADVVIGSRRARGASVERRQAWWKVWLGQAGNMLIQVLLVRGIRDTRCGFKLFSDRTRRLFELQRLNRWGFDDELLFLARKYSFRLTEVPVRWLNDTQSKVRGRDYLQSLLEIAMIHFNNIRGLYRQKS